jgi:hypothetical protein
MADEPLGTSPKLPPGRRRSTLDDPFAHSDGSDEDPAAGAGAAGPADEGGNGSFSRPLRSALRLSSRRYVDDGGATGGEDAREQPTNSSPPPRPVPPAATWVPLKAPATDTDMPAALTSSEPRLDDIVSSHRPVAQRQLDDDLWKTRRKHVFVLSSAGKPIFTRYGDESDFSELFGILQVLISMAQTSSIRGSAHDALRRVTCGPGFSMHFFIQEELYFVMVTRTEESPRSCVRQLKLLYHQLQSVLPTINSVLRKNPGYDIRRIFSDRDAAVMRQLIKRMSIEPVYLLRAQQAAGMSPEARRELGKVLLRTYRPGDPGEDRQHVFSFLAYHGKILATASLERQDKVHVEDVLLLMNFVSSLCASQAGEIWAPFCMPRFNDSGYLWCYVMNLSEAARTAANIPLDTSETSPYARGSGVLLIQLATSQESFSLLSDTAHDVCSLLGLNRIEQLEKTVERDTEFPIQAVATQQLEAGEAAAEGGHAAGSLPAAPGGGGVLDPLLWVAVVTESQQLVCSAWPTLLRFSKSERKMFLRLLVHLRDKLLQISTASVPTILHSVDPYNVLVQRQTGVGDVYAMFLPCTTKRFMAAAGTLIARAVKSKESTFTFVKNVQWPAQ